MRIRPAAIVTLLAALFAGLVLATALPGTAAAAGKPCWERVISDWLDDGVIDGKYSVKCYQAALRNVQEDLRDYSNITDAINAAMQDALRSGGGSSGSGGSGDESPGAEKDRTLQASPPRSYYRRAIDSLGTTSADSLPIPLLVLAGLGTALLLSAAGLAARKRLKARARPPAPPS
jgi:hypothetical protein